MVEIHKCETECREELLECINKKVGWKSICSFAGTFIIIVIFAYGIYANGVEKTDKVIKQNTDTTTQNALAVARIDERLKTLERGQTVMQSTLDDNFKILLDTIKEKAAKKLDPNGG